MKTITPFELQMLIDKRYVELIDVRPKRDFEEMHVLVARSIPLCNLKPHSLLVHRRDHKDVPFYIIGDTETEASLAACALASAGSPEPIIVKGGINAWNGQCLPVVRGHRSRIPHVEMPTAAILAVATLFVAGLFHKAFLFAAVVGVVVAMPHFLRYWAGNARIPKVANGKFLHQRLEADQMVQVRMRGID